MALRMLLGHRGVLRVVGRDALTLLQGLTTNDLRRLEPGGVCYSSLLSAQGRVLFDVFVFRGHGDEGPLLVECDRQQLPTLQSHLQRFKLRAKADIAPDADGLVPLCVLNAPDAATALAHADAAAVAGGGSDPRFAPGANIGAGVSSMWRFLVRAPPAATDPAYHQLRARLGLVEGPAELPVDKALPLEYNYDLLNGVSWTKGCYLGQELTSRTHHLGQVRKRVLPIQVTAADGASTLLSPGAEIMDGSRAVGKIIAQHSPTYALAMLRLSHVDCASLVADGHRVKAEVPAWWPDSIVAKAKGATADPTEAL